MTQRAKRETEDLSIDSARQQSPTIVSSDCTFVVAGENDYFSYADNHFVGHLDAQSGFEAMLNEENARKLAAHWVRAWNSHNLTDIMSHYAEDIILLSPVAARILNEPMGMVRGKDNLRVYFQKGLEAYPNLQFDLLDVMWGLSSVVLYYVNQKGTKTGEFMELDSSSKFVRVVAHYNG